MAVWRGPYPFDGDSHESTLALQDCFPSSDIRCAPTIFNLVLLIVMIIGAFFPADAYARAGLLASDVGHRIQPV